MARPDRRLAVAVHRSIRERPLGTPIAARASRAAAIYAEQGWRVLVATERDRRAWARAMRSGATWCPGSTR